MLSTALLLLALSGPQLPAEKPPQTPAPAPQPAKPPAVRQSPTTGRPTLTVLVTDRTGKPLEGVTIAAVGPVQREGTTDADGTLLLRNMAAGTYRLHFEHQGYVPFEREVTVQTRAVKTNAELSDAPPPPPPPKPEPAPAPAAAPPPPPSGPPTSVSIPDFVEKNYVGGAPSRSSPVGCTGTSKATLLQLRDPLAEHSHADADEMLYVVAGEGVQKIDGKEVALTAGTFAVVPRGTSHSISRKGSRPVILLSILTGPPCEAGK
jgi:mannose-6-phosphate isomerase-like protein (cupin superfamily)